MKLVTVLVLVLVVALSGCGLLTHGILGEMAIQDTAICLQHPKYGRICVNGRGEVFYEKIIPPALEKPQVDEWARAQAGKEPPPTEVSK